MSEDSNVIERQAETITALHRELADARSLIRILAGYTSNSWMKIVDQRHIAAYAAATMSDEERIRFYKQEDEP